MSFQPANEDHAVVSCEFGFGLTAPISARVMNHIRANHSQWSDLLPAAGISEMDPDLSIVQLLPGGNTRALNFANLRPNGTAVWALRCGFNELLLTCTRYTRWTPTWETARGLISKVLETIAAVDSAAGIGSVALKVTDVFSTENANYNLEEALQRGYWVGDAAFRAGTYWHCNSGWFDAHDAGEALSTLQVNVVGVSGRFNLQIEHSQSLTLSDQHSLSDSTETWNVVEAMMSKLHQSNKRTLAHLLQPAMAEKIRLTEATS